MSDNDRGALLKAQESAGLHDMFKAATSRRAAAAALLTRAAEIMTKGDLPNHEFRGNQYTSGSSDAGDVAQREGYGPRDGHATHTHPEVFKTREAAQAERDRVGASLERAGFEKVGESSNGRTYHHPGTGQRATALHTPVSYRDGSKGYNVGVFVSDSPASTAARLMRNKGEAK